MEPELQTRMNGGGTVQKTGDKRWRMEIPAGAEGAYRLAELDDHLDSARSRYPWRAPVRLELYARISSVGLPGTWGFGFWNNPFSASLGIRGMAQRLPALPNAAWFFSAGQPNYLAFHDTHPAQGLLAATFASARVPAFAMAPAILALPLLAFPPAARLIRRAARLLVRDDAMEVAGDPTLWRNYQVDVEEEQVRFFCNGQEIFTTYVAPRGALGLVIWIDNQYAAFPPSGKLRAGTSPNPEPAWLEVDGVQLSLNAV